MRYGYSRIERRGNYPLGSGDDCARELRVPGQRKAALYSTQLVRAVCKVGHDQAYINRVLSGTSGRRYCLLCVPPLQVDLLDAPLFAYEEALEPYAVSLVGVLVQENKTVIVDNNVPSVVFSHDLRRIFWGVD